MVLPWPLDELSCDEDRSGADQGDRMGCACAWAASSGVGRLSSGGP